MKHLLSAVCFVFFTLAVMAQAPSFVVSGKVIDAVSKAPLQAASVFAQSTMVGTATNAQGEFSLRLFNGGYDLVFTFTGYETVTRRITTADEADKNIVIELKQKEKAMEEVSIVTSNEVKNGLEKYGDFFMDNFIGTTGNSKQCTIKNKTALRFYFSKKRNRLKVLADEPLLIENAAMGYTLKYTLDSFTHDYTSLVSMYTGYPLFEEMPPADAAQSTQWHQRRMAAYNGSILHFMRSVYGKQIKEQGFELQFIVKNGETEQAIHLKNLYGAIQHTKDDSTQVVEITPNQPELAVLYKKELPDTTYLLSNDDAPKDFQLSMVTIAAGQSIGIEQNGFYYNQSDITSSGYWGWKKIADMLPYDFVPSP